MKNLFLTLAFFIALSQVQAQKTVSIKGQIESLNSTEPIYISLGEALYPLKLSNDGTFSVSGSIQQSPSFFYLASISKRSKIVQQTPLIWFENENIKFNIDWTDKSYKMTELMPFQSTSEKVEALEGQEQIEFLLNHPNNIPSLYFANKNKERVSISDLEKFSQKVNEEYKNSIYLKRIENYLSAKKRKTLKKGSKVEDFKLPNKEGQQVSVINRSDKTQLITLFSSGCSYSVSSIGFLEQLIELNDNKIELTTIWDDQSKDTWLNTHQDKKSKITWTNLWDEYGFASTYLNRTMWPTFYVINKDGELTDILKGFNKRTVKKLEKLVE